MNLRRQFAEYLVKECNLSPLSAFTYEQGLNRLERFVGKPAEELTSRDLRTFLRSDYHPSTKNSTLVAAKAFHKWGALEELWPLNGIMSVRGPRLVHNPKPSLSSTEASRLLELCTRPNELRAVYLGLYAGCRVSESACVTASEWIEDNEACARLRFFGKGGKVREVPVHYVLAERRDEILANDTTDCTLKQVCRSLAHVTGIRFSSHTLRRTFAVTLSEAGVERDVIATLLGHAPALVTTRSYAPVRWDEKRRAIALLRY